MLSIPSLSVYTSIIHNKMSMNIMSLFRIRFGCIPSPQVIPMWRTLLLSFPLPSSIFLCFDHRFKNTSLLSLPTDKVAFKFRLIVKYRYLAFYVFLIFLSASRVFMRETWNPQHALQLHTKKQHSFDLSCAPWSDMSRMVAASFVIQHMLRGRMISPPNYYYYYYYNFAALMFAYLTSCYHR
jgi:hypothetical protein